MHFTRRFLFLVYICSLFWLQISYLVMFAYISLTLGDTPRLSSFYISSKVWSHPRFQCSSISWWTFMLLWRNALLLFSFRNVKFSAKEILSYFLYNWYYKMTGFQVLLGLCGVMLVMLSVLASVGFFSAIGVKSTLIIMEVIPFLVLAVSSYPSCIF